MNARVVALCVLETAFWLCFALGGETDGDLLHYYVFADAFPVLYTDAAFGFYSVVYLPHFYFYIYPVYALLTAEAAYWVFSIVNAVCVADLLRLCQRFSPTHFWLAWACVFFALTSLAKWANVELVVAYVMVLHCLHVREKGAASTSDAFLVAFFSFKIYSLVVVPLGLLELKRGRVRYVLTLGLALVLLNLPFLLLNADAYSVRFLLEVIAGGPEVIQKVWLMRYRVSFTILVGFLALKGKEMRKK